MTQEAEITWPAETAANINDVEADDQCLYERQTDGTYRLCAKARDAEAAWKAREVADAEGAATELAAMHARHDRDKAHLREILASDAIRAALVAGGCKIRLLNGATSLLLKELPIVTEEIDGQMVVGLESGFTIEQAVSAWLLGETGEQFAAPVTEVGAFTEAIRKAALKNANAA